MENNNNSLDISLFSIYGYGSVAEDKNVGANVIEVFLKDRTYAAEGNVAESKKELLTVNNSDGVVKTEETEVKKTIPARWAALNQPNRLTSPDVRKNETVIIYRYANNDDYWWDTIFTEDNLRGKETVTYAFKNTDDLVRITFENSYIIHVSTKDKIIQIHTSINDGEKVGYDIILDTGESILSTEDTRGNYNTLWSLKDHWKTKTNKVIEFETEKVLITANTSFTLDTPLAIINADKWIQTGTDSSWADTNHIVGTTNLSITSIAGEMTSGDAGMYYSKKLFATDLTTNSVASQNGHRHNGVHGTTSPPIG